MHSVTQVKLTRNFEYHLEDRWIKVPAGTVVNYREEENCAYIANENELFHCDKEHVEAVLPSKLFVVPGAPANEPHLPFTNQA